MRSPCGLTITMIVLAMAVCSAQGGAARTPDELAAALQRKYATVRDFSADFTQTYTGGVLQKQVTERGHVLVKKPGRMRWEYTNPEKKLFVSDGARTYFYVPEDRQVIVGQAAEADEANTSVLFLAGRGDLVRDFQAFPADAPSGLPADTQAIKLVPRSAQRDYDSIVLAFAPRSLELRGLITTDAQGGRSSFLFRDLKENVSPADKEFAFTIPRGVDVISDGSATGTLAR